MAVYFVNVGFYRKDGSEYAKASALFSYSGPISGLLESIVMEYKERIAPGIDDLQGVVNCVSKVED